MKKGLTGPKQQKSFLDNYRALTAAMAFLLISFCSQAQIHQPPSLWGKAEDRHITYKAWQGPTGNGAPTSTNKTAVKNFALYFDSTNFQLYIYNPKTNIWDTVHIGIDAGGATGVTSVSAGNGMNFTTITATGAVTMGTPGSTTLASTNAVTTNSHTHAFAPGGLNTQYIDGTGALQTTPVLTNEWHLNGNTVGAVKSIGPIDNYGFRIITNNIQSGYLDLTTGNTSFGQSALLGNTSGYSNVAIGDSALKANTSGFWNTAVGNQALFTNSTAVGNTAVGYGALKANTNASSNTAIGRDAAVANTTGSGNTIVGAIAFSSNTIGNNNTAVGVQALAANTLGGGNVAIGIGALSASTVGHRNVALGYYAGAYNVTDSNRFYLNNDDRVNRAGDTTKSLVYGTFHSTPTSQRFKINGRLEVNDGTQGAGKVFTSDADGNGSWQTPVGGTTSLTQYRLAVGDGSNLLSDNAAITGNRALISDANGVPTHATTTATEIAYVNGVTSAIQTQLNSKAASGANTDITSVLLNQTGLVVKGASSNALIIKPNETLSADRTLNIIVNDANRTITVPADATISGTNTGDQTTVSGNAGTATALQNTRTIWGQNFNGTANITGTLALGTADLTMTGSLAATGARVTKGWFTDVESTNMYTVGGTSLSSTFSPIAGSASIVTVGTIGTGTWQGTTIGASYLPTGLADGATKGITAFNATYFNDAAGVVTIDATNGLASSSQSGYATTNQITGSTGTTVDGQGGVVSTGTKGSITIPYNCTITNWYVSADVSGSIQFDLKRSGTSIIGAGNKPLLSSAQTGNAAVSSWTSTAVTAGDILTWIVDSATTITNATVILKVIK